MAHQENEKLRDGWARCREALQNALDELQATQEHLQAVKREAKGEAADQAELERQMSGLSAGNADLVRRLQAAGAHPNPIDARCRTPEHPNTLLGGARVAPPMLYYVL